ncbi:asparagine synthetase domain-containing protein CG17486 isoform X2 [Agrilus planipennis]|uniref:Asparagine synthetase domain-containing protein CG17486 isoform X2 n=1 Tax=Agrilus planipennis TaxID=224129 RepID=A0A1W4XGF3_AGRPL|nr:asparagine synthetase domain-containing protein CG17486 isoform X2 [Agrilus planipennis]
MCGIFCTFTEQNCSQCLLLENHKLCCKAINNRGPDFQRTISLNVNDLHFIFAVSVLWLQGKNLTEQPVQTNNGTFMYNGDIFDYTKEICEFDPSESDTLTLMRFIESEGIYQALSVCNGPFSFIYLDTQSCKLHFGRDHFGRRSLLIGKLDNMFIITSSAKRKSNWEFIELPPLGIFSYDINAKMFELTAWEKKSENFEQKLKEVESFLNSNINLKDQHNEKQKINFRLPYKEELNIFEQIKSKDFESNIRFLFSLEQWFSKVTLLERLLREAVRKRVHIQPKECSSCIFKKECHHALTGVLFSGGIDCAILAFLCDKFSSKERPIDLINVAFSKTNNYNTPDRETGLSTLEELKELCPDRKWNFVEINISEDKLNEKRNQVIADLIYPLNTVLDDSLGCALWFAARGENSTYRSTCRNVSCGRCATRVWRKNFVEMFSVQTGFPKSCISKKKSVTIWFTNSKQ